MKLYGLIGYPLTHSFSESYFQKKFRTEKIENCIYKNFPLENISSLNQLIGLFKELEGLNVTIPYKEEVIPFLDIIDPFAAEIGAINVIKIIKSPDKWILKGYNTDVYGFTESLRPLINKDIQYKALVLGTGGASKAVCMSLSQLGIDYIKVSRKSGAGNNTISYSDINKQIMYDYNIIVNATPVGMYPQINLYPEIPYNLLTKDHLLYDLIYNPEETQFLKFGRFNNAKVKNGYDMLVLQAEKSWEIFSG